MIGFIVRRCIAAIVVLALVTLVVFTIFFKGPSNPAQPICDARPPCSDEELINIERQMGLDDPLLTAYGTFIKGVFAGREIKFSEAEVYDCSAPCFGISYNTRNEVSDELADKYPATLSLAIGGAVLYLVIGVVAGSIAARYRGSVLDRGLMTGTLVISAVPYYVIALLAWIMLTQKFPIFPDTNYKPLFDNPIAWAGALLLPWLVLGLTNATAYSRYTRGQMVETMGEDYMRTAVAKGQTRNVVIFKHGLRAAIIPVVTIFGLDFGTLLGGTVFTEQIFGIDGVGRWGLQAIAPPSNIPVVTTTVLVAAFFIILSNLLVDIIYSFLDPRVKLS